MAKRIVAFLCIFTLIITVPFCLCAQGAAPGLSRESVSLYPGQVFRISLNDDSAFHTFISKDINVAQVDETGKILAVNPGTTDILCRLSDKTELKCAVNVREGAPPDSVMLDRQFITMKKGDSTKLSARVIPSNHSSKIFFTSSDTGVASVDDNGNITAAAIGTTVITAESDSSAVQAGCFVRVLDDSEVPDVSAGITGVLYDADGEKLSAVKVKLEGDAAGLETTTDKDGRFFYKNISSGNYILSVCPGEDTEKTVSSDIIVNSGNNSLSCIVTDNALCIMYGSNNNLSGELREIILNEKDISLNSGDNYEIDYKLVPAEISIASLHFSSDDPSIAEVDDTGRITALNEGNTVIRISSSSGNPSAFITVSVKRYGTGLFGASVLLLLVLIAVLVVTVYVYRRRKDTENNHTDKEETE